MMCDKCNDNGRHNTRVDMNRPHSAPIGNRPCKSNACITSVELRKRLAHCVCYANKKNVFERTASIGSATTLKAQPGKAMM